jgi:hypothetical protein
VAAQARPQPTRTAASGGLAVLPGNGTQTKIGDEIGNPCFKAIHHYQRLQKTEKHKTEFNGFI